MKENNQQKKILDINKDTLTEVMGSALENYFKERCEYCGLDANTVEKQATQIRFLRADDKTPWNKISEQGYPKKNKGSDYLVYTEDLQVIACNYSDNLMAERPLDFFTAEPGFYYMQGNEGFMVVRPMYWKEIKLPQ